MTSHPCEDGCRYETLERELERWRHGVTIEGDFVCPNALAVSNLQAEIRDLRAAEIERIAAWLQVRTAEGSSVGYLTEIARRTLADEIRAGAWRKP